MVTMSLPKIKSSMRANFEKSNTIGSLREINCVLLDYCAEPSGGKKNVKGTVSQDFVHPVFGSQSAASD